MKKGIKEGFKLLFKYDRGFALVYMVFLSAMAWISLIFNLAIVGNDLVFSMAIIFSVAAWYIYDSIVLKYKLEKADNEIVRLIEKLYLNNIEIERLVFRGKRK